MTKALPFTQASIVRRIKAAQAAGLRVQGIGPDGTVMVDTSGETSPSAVHNSDQRAQTARTPSKWEDVEA